MRPGSSPGAAGLRHTGAGAGVHAGVTSSSARPRSTPTTRSRAPISAVSNRRPRHRAILPSSAGLLPASSADAITPDIEPAAMAEVVEILRDAGVLTEEPRALLPPAENEQSRLALIQEHVAADPASAAQLAYLANALVAGCSIQGRPFTPREASEAAAAICNLGLENWPPHWNEMDLVTAFQVGWTVLHRDVSILRCGAAIRSSPGSSAATAIFNCACADCVVN